MKILLIGKERDIGLAYNTLRDAEVIDKLIYWDDDYGPEELESDMLAVYDAVVVVIEDEKHARYLYELLVCIMGDDESKIIDFYALYRAFVPTMIVDRRVKNAANFETHLNKGS